MCYLILEKDCSLQESLRLVYMAFMDYEQAEEFAKKNCIDGIITDDISSFFNS